MTKTSKISLCILVVILVVFGAWRFHKNAGLGDDSVIKIGWIGPLTGDSAVLGTDSAEAARIAIDTINASGGVQGKKLELISEDDQYLTTKSINAYEKLVNVDKAKIILIQTYGGVFALSDRAKNDGVVLIDCLDSNDNLAKLGDSVFSIGVESESISRLLSDYANRQGYKQAGILFFQSDTFMPYVKDKFTEGFQGKVIAEGYTTGATDFKTPLTKMKGANIDSLVCLGYDECGIAIRQARNLGINAQVLMPGTIMSPGLQKAATGQAEGAIFTFWFASKEAEPAKSFVDKFKSAQGREPFVDLFAYPSYDAITSIAYALNKANLDMGTFKMELRNVHGIPGVTGEINFANDGTMRIPFTLFKLVNSSPVALP